MYNKKIEFKFNLRDLAKYLSDKYFVFSD